MKNIYNIILRILIFVTIVIVAYAFFNNPSTLFNKLNSSSDLKIEIYYKTVDSLLMNGNLNKKDNIVSMSGNIKSYNPAKLNSIELTFQQFDKSDIQVGQETLLINKEISKNEIISFKKEGFTLDNKTNYIIIIPKAIK